ncbi:MAG: PAS domain S-box protein [Planctomycetes bacterium]|nr:PAS domain S-box protein [Planctomycetota bacterium]MBL7041899.1 PAS domain S-box protein [Pirellulaceae bacterium]
MKIRSKLVWKLSAVVVAILIAAIAFCGYFNNLIAAHYSLESSKAFLRFNSESIIQGVRQLMMTRNNQAIEELIVEMSEDSEVYGDIRLVSHHSGEVVACRFGRTGRRLVLEDPSCAVCHDQSDLGGADAEIVDTVLESPEGNRVLSVMAPILNEPRCRTAACHAHADDPPILGFLNADYSLERMDAMVADRRILVLLTVLTSTVLGVIALWFMFARLLERPISGLISGTKRIAAKEFDFRFDSKRNDEIGVLEESFNIMTGTIQADRDELRGAKEYVEGIVENSADLIITVNPQGLVQTFNRGAEQALGYSRDEVIGQRIETLFADPRDREKAIARLNDTDNVRNFETRFVAKEGHVREVLLTLSRLRDGKGNAIGTTGISKDVTQENKLYRQLVQSQKLAAIGQAVTGIQHAINNMLNALAGGTWLVRKGLAKDDRRRITEGWTMVEEGIERIGDLSRSMLDYAREWKLELKAVDMKDLMAKVCELNRQSAVDCGVVLRHEIPDGLPALLCDPKLIHMATTDIVVNAIDACSGKDYRSGERAEIVLKNSLTDDEDFFVIEIRDNGCGMSEEIRRNIFTPFFSTKEKRGTGLGLAVTAKVINVHGGEIVVESETDQGTTFRVRLPINGAKATKETVDGQASTLS